MDTHLPQPLLLYCYICYSYHLLELQVLLLLLLFRPFDNFSLVLQYHTHHNDLRYFAHVHFIIKTTVVCYHYVASVQLQ